MGPRQRRSYQYPFSRFFPCTLGPGSSSSPNLLPSGFLDNISMPLHLTLLSTQTSPPLKHSLDSKLSFHFPPILCPKPTRGWLYHLLTLPKSSNKVPCQPPILRALLTACYYFTREHDHGAMALENAEGSQPFIPGTGLEAEAGVLQIQSYGNYSMSLRIPAQLSKTVANRR